MGEGTLMFGFYLQKKTNVTIVRRRFCQPDQTRSLPFQQSFFFFFYFFHVCHPGTEFCTEYQDWSCDTAHCAILWFAGNKKATKYCYENKVHSFFKQCFAWSLLDIILGYFHLIFKLTSADIRHQLKVPSDCVKWKLCKKTVLTMNGL